MKKGEKLLSVNIENGKVTVKIAKAGTYFMIVSTKF